MGTFWAYGTCGLYRGCIGLYRILSHILENQGEKSMEHNMETGVIQGVRGCKKPGSMVDGKLLLPLVKRVYRV